MSGIDDLCRLPIVLAPMAGGPSTPELTAAVSEAGGLGVLAGGYLSPEELGRRIAAVERLTDRPFGANLFSPPARAETSPEQAAELRRYRELLVELGYPPELLPETPVFDDDGYRAKLEVVADSRAAVVSTAFGYPDEAATRLLRSRGKAIALKATTPEEIEYLDKADCDAIVVQGREAGGHRATVLSPRPRPARRSRLVSSSTTPAARRRSRSSPPAGSPRPQTSRARCAAVRRPHRRARRSSSPRRPGPRRLTAAPCRSCAAGRRR